MAHAQTSTTVVSIFKKGSRIYRKGFEIWPLRWFCMDVCR